MKIVDLFSGAGGLTFGFYYKLHNGKFIINDNCKIVFANEYDKFASQAFSKNFPNVRMINQDIRDLQENDILSIIGDDEIDLIIGGPPCQSFSTIGCRVYDDKAKLYNEYLRILSIIRPRMFLFENVKGMLSMRNENGELIIHDIERKFAQIYDGIGYRILYEVLDAADFGVPQHRERVFIIGIRDDVEIDFEFPRKHFGCDGAPYISIEQAISDLPLINAGENIVEYTKSPTNEYQRLMRCDCDFLSCHFAGIHGDKIQTIINHVPPGEGRYYINKLVDDGVLDEKYRLTSGYKNTYGRLVSHLPCKTITNNMCTPSGLRCIHYSQNRALTPREGARIQSFPDWFSFVGSKGNITTQIGNAVPPLLALQLAQNISQVLE